MELAREVDLGVWCDGGFEGTVVVGREELGAGCKNPRSTRSRKVAEDVAVMAG
jgi:hypothetical protein